MDDEELNALRAKRMAELQGQGVRILFSFRTYQMFQGFLGVFQCGQIVMCLKLNRN